MNFFKEVEKLNINIDNTASLKFEDYYKKLVEVNEVMNLTSITEHEEVYNKHFLDSLSLALYLDLSKEQTLLDVGSGAGFPSIPLAIVSNNIKVTIIDALNKRINFLNDLSKELNLDNVKALHIRAEEYAKEKRNSFDVVTARAVARLNVLTELCLPLVKVGGVFVAMKGSDSDIELEEAKNAINVLGGKLEKVINFELPDNAGSRTLIVIKKVSNTKDKYPRAFARIKERPL
ncbi:MAG: 16S rRNA (guanine(527)-N(7))-methyltransferase RsmG [Acholeplasmatales bacterium]|nr:16S rRNA (guanine(527)-N(7))-methyltransferase RsmG [Acholeplasmatales bacterium]